MITSDIHSFYRTAFGVAATQVISRLFGQLIENMPGTRDGSDIEALHDMRVASRRLRAALRVFRPCFPDEYWMDVEDMIRSITQALGVVRDHDVFINYLHNYRKANPKQNIKWLIKKEQDLRELEREQMLQALDSFAGSDPESKISVLLESVSKTWADSNKLRKNQFGERAIAPVQKRIAAIMTFDEIIGNEEDNTGLHLMRIAAKKLRYTLEAFAPCFGPPFLDAINSVKSIQEYLGQLHDCDVWIEKLKGYLQDSKNADSLNNLIADRIQARHNAYLNAVESWNLLKESVLPPLIQNLSADKS